MTTTTVENRTWREKLLDVRESRHLATPLIKRTDAASGSIVLEGYAATFDAYDVYGGIERGGWIEQIDKRAFDVTLGARPDVQLLVNHEGWPLARTKSGTLQLSADDHGLLVRAMLDPNDPDVQRLLPKMNRGDMDEMSFAFHVRAQDWSSDYSHRLITEINLQKGDVSVVNYGMNPNTAAMLSEAVDALTHLSNHELAELRSMVDETKVEKAIKVLQHAKRASKPAKYSGVDEFADPGYLDRDGKPAKDGSGVKRYPLNTAARVRNAAARFAQNKSKYSSSQQSAIMGKIQAAAKKFNIDISDQKSLHHYEVARGSDGAGILVGILTDGTAVPVPSTAPFSVPAVQNTRAMGQSFGGTPVWNPLTNALEVDGYTKENHDQQLMGAGTINPAGGGAPQIPTAGGYDPHTQAFDKQYCANDDGEDDDDMDDREQDALDTFRTDDGVDDEIDPNTGDPMHKPDAGGKIHGDEDDRATSTAPGGKLGGDDDDDDDQTGARGLDGVLAAALESTIVTCLEMAEAKGDSDMRNMLARARRQVRDLQGGPANNDSEVNRKLNALRSEFGDPDTLTVSEGLRALQQAGFADTMHENVAERRRKAAEPFPNEGVTA